MKTQNQIKRTLSEESSLLYLNNVLDNKSFTNRIDVAKEVCQEFNFYDPKGQKQVSGCAKALRILESAGHIQLPVTTRKTSGKRSPQRLNTPVPSPLDVPPTVDEIKGLELKLVETGNEVKIWNELMIAEHPLGSGIFVGRQLRYLIHSSHGYLGEIAGFAWAIAHALPKAV